MERVVKSVVAFACICSLSGCGIIPQIAPAPTQAKPAQEQTIPAELPEMTLPIVTTEAFLQTEPVETEPEIEETAPVVTTSPVVDQETKIQRIRTWYQNIMQATNLEKRFYGTSAEIYWQNGTIVAITEYHQLNDAFDPAMETIHYYYHDGEPFFVFIEYDHCEYEEVRLYFEEGQLIRWKIDQNDPKDNIPNAKWQAYYTEACTALQNAPRS